MQLLKKDAPIGIFDSGVGGFTLLKELLRELPQENCVYLADTKNCPYGEKSVTEIKKIVTSICQYLVTYSKVKMILMGCNYSSAVALPIVKDMFGIPIIGLVDIGLTEAIKVTKNNRIGLIATKGTIRSGIYQKKFNKLTTKKNFYVRSCSKFVPLIEAGKLNDEETYKVAKNYLTYLKNKNIDTLIIGCTHYPYLEHIIRDIMGEKVKLVNPAKGIIIEAKKILNENNILTDKKRRSIKFLSTGNYQSLIREAKKFLGIKIKKVEIVKLS